MQSPEQPSSRHTPLSPPARPFLGHLWDFRRDRLHFLQECVRRFGDFVPLRFGPRRAFLLNTPEMIEQVLVTQHRAFTKSAVLRRTSAVFGNGLLTSEGEFWRNQRKRTQPAFHRDQIAAYSHVVIACGIQHRERWAENQVCDIHAEMLHLSLRIAMQTLFGTDREGMEEFVRAQEVAQEMFQRWIGVAMLLPSWYPTPTPPRLARAIRELDAVVYAILRERCADEEDRGDLLASLLQNRDAEGDSAGTEKQLRDEVLTLLLAGHETTAAVLTWAWYLLGLHPEVEAKFSEELDNVLQGRTPTLQDQSRLKVTEQIVLEAMRLYPPAWSMGRTAISECQIGAYRIPAGADVLFSPFLIHRDGRYFADPECFRPERWEGDFAKTLPRFAYLPFGGGPRICIGNTFAMMEAILLLATLGQLWRPTLQTAVPVAPVAAFTLRPQHAISVLLKPRQTF